MQAHENDRKSGNDREPMRISSQETSNHARAGAERNEHGRKAEHEQQRRRRNVALGATRQPRIRQPLERGPGQVDEIGRHQRQHARREKAQHSGRERGHDGHVGRHGN